MADATPQNYANHVVIPKKFLVIVVIMLLAAILATIGLLNTGSIVGTCCIGTAILIQSLSAIYGLFIMRNYAVRLQDRIIRTEMRLRLAEVLPDDLALPSKQLATKQLVGLRFASDAELPDLVRKVLDEKIEKADAIKKLITDWQGDYDRV